MAPNLVREQMRARLQEWSITPDWIVGGKLATVPNNTIQAISAEVTQAKNSEYARFVVTRENDVGYFLNIVLAVDVPREELPQDEAILAGLVELGKDFARLTITLKKHPVESEVLISWLIIAEACGTVLHTSDF